ncbi:hypothetical protein [Agarivorans sp. DSG3-1]|uniref:hypothetical protein n=1 Tax=Agarivorans sp. DSG3-1 TaxID=3342249 RepID=UPI00398EFAD7
MAGLHTLRSELAQAKERILKIETYFKVAFAVAAIFGLAGAFGASIISSIKSEIAVLSADKDKLAEVIGEIKRDAVNAIVTSEKESLAKISSARNGAISRIDGEVSEEISNFLSNSEVVTLYKCPVGTGGWTPGGAWGSYGCQGQISTHSQCTNIEHPNVQNRDCNELGTFKLAR